MYDAVESGKREGREVEMEVKGGGENGGRKEYERMV